MQQVDHSVAGARSVATATTPAELLDVHDLTVTFPSASGPVQVVRGLSYSIARGETLGIVGESGCGKTMTSLALLGLIAGGGKVGGTIDFGGRNLASFSQRQWQQLRGRDIAMIFQEPMTAMNPVMPVGRQIGEVLTKHEKLSRRQAEMRAVDLLASVGIPSPARRAQDYPHQLSGGMRQRAMIAMALACRPIHDESNRERRRHLLLHDQCDRRHCRCANRAHVYIHSVRWGGRHHHGNRHRQRC